MRLPVELFEEILQSANIHLEGRRSEKREEGRAHLSVRTVMIPIVGGRGTLQVPVRLRDLSVAGVGVLHEQPMRPGEQFAIRLERRDREAIWAQCVVTRWHPVGDRLYVIGAAFTQLFDLAAGVAIAAAAVNRADVAPHVEEVPPALRADGDSITGQVPREPAGDPAGPPARLLTSVIETLNDLAAVELSPTTVMRMIVDRSRAVTNADGAVIELAEGRDLVYRAASGAAVPHLGMRVPIASSLSGTCLTANRLLSCEDSDTDPRVDRAACRGTGVRSMIVVPLPLGNAAGGVLKVFSCLPRAFGPDQEHALRLMAGVFAAAIHNAAEFDAKRKLIEQRTSALIALRESEERFRNAFEHAAIGMALVGLDCRWLQVNPSLCRILGRGREELLCLTFAQITHPADLDADMANLRRLLAGEIDHYRMSKRYLHKQGHAVPVVLTASLVRDASGKPLHFIAQVQETPDCASRPAA